MKKINIPISIIQSDNGREYIDFIMPQGEEIRIEITYDNDYYPEDKDTYRYPNNNDDGMVYNLGEETYSFMGACCVYDDDKIKLRRALVRAFVNRNAPDGDVELSQSYFKENN